MMMDGVCFHNADLPLRSRTRPGDMAPGLRHLTAFGNRIAEVPRSIGDLSRLEALALNDNKIGPLLPETLHGLKKLVSIDLSDNKLIALPEVIKHKRNFHALCI